MRLAARVILAMILCAVLGAPAAAQQDIIRSGEFVPAGQAPPPAPPPPQRPPPAPPANTIVDYPRVFSEMNETQDQRQLLETQRAFVSGEMTRRSGAIGDLVRERSAMKPASPEAGKLTEQIDKQKLEMQQWAAVQQGQFEREQKSQMARLFKKVEAAVEEVAKKHDIALPVNPNPPIPDDLSTLKMDQVRGMALKRAIPKPEGAPDLSDEVIQLLNERYAAEVKTPTTAP